ncbi:hypothetical protein HBI56_134650 [Parastagonospora nodorum]|uniref:Uncharacterized protein n=1 Tax=Phaeosphaeria nodorum (strain SN15 / ATCC MYA-4574 / FGSC 10173) TaxID=321614 RepID=A0A7U2F7G8_PHANO|nr:hypothetical protein HBH56_037750 [Parastagonospora nodorum]QRC99921.1 hypothetical protein JI435_414280 [Parastagonospora nodorum SN15]KAH3933627.1 hypothetical protein HBH54_061710 [Parastagonospora nodorum]KAH3952678.1 hypothetical protein HBH53_048400 [Parastagonospora nodorum]KAH3980103.1 hypothetical protein HBH52_095550 [Parastagonospora nodorum]
MRWEMVRVEVWGRGGVGVAEANGRRAEVTTRRGRSLVVGKTTWSGFSCRWAVWWDVPRARSLGIYVGSQLSSAQQTPKNKGDCISAEGNFVLAMAEPNRTTAWLRMSQ